MPVTCLTETLQRPSKKFTAFPFFKKRFHRKKIESVNASYRKVTKKGAFPNEDSVYKSLYLRATELEKKWKDSKVQNCSKVLNQLLMDDRLAPRIEHYMKG